MAETSHGETRSVRHEPSIKARVGRFVGVGLAAATLGLGIDQGTANADDPPKTSTSVPVASPTPDTIANRQAMLEAIEKRNKELADKKALDDKIAAAQARQDALTTPTATPTSPPPTSTPNAVATAQAQATIAQRTTEFIATIAAKDEAAAKAQATPPLPTATSEPKYDPTPQSTPPPEGTGSVTGGDNALGFVKKNFGIIGTSVGSAIVGAIIYAGGALGLSKLKEARRHLARRGRGRH